MSKKEFKTSLRSIMSRAWQMVKKNGFTLSEALKIAWANAKLVAVMHSKICKFYFQKVDGSIREAYGTLKAELIPDTKGDDRKRNDTVQVYFDTEKSEWRCFKRANLIKIA